MSYADSVAVNSGFTKSVVGKVWPNFAKTKELHIVYPCVDVKDKEAASENGPATMWHNTDIVLSINRFEEKKDIGLAIKAYAGLGKAGRQGVRLVLAGMFFRLWSYNSADWVFRWLRQPCARECYISQTPCQAG